MPRPHVINEPAQTYNLLLPAAQLSYLRWLAHAQGKPSPAYMIREAINEYLERHHVEPL